MDALERSVRHVAVDRGHGNTQQLGGLLTRIRLLRTRVLLGSNSFAVHVVGFECLKKHRGGQIQNVRRQHGRRGIQGLGRNVFVNLHFFLLMKIGFGTLKRKAACLYPRHRIVGAQVKIFRLFLCVCSSKMQKDQQKHVVFSVGILS